MAIKYNISLLRRIRIENLTSNKSSKHRIILPDKIERVHRRQEIDDEIHRYNGKKWPNHV